LHPFAQLVGKFEEGEVVDALDADSFRQKFGGSNQCSSHDSLVLSFLDFIPNTCHQDTELERSNPLLIPERGERDRTIVIKAK
jgi:hypothetical protein